MLDQLYDVLGGSKTLTVTNVILSVCIIFHLCCEFAHYIHEFVSRRKQGQELKANAALLKELKELIERIEAQNGNGCKKKCSKEVLP